MPSPLKPAPAAGMAIPSKRQGTPLFGDDDVGDDTAMVDDGDVVVAGDGDAEERDDDWIIDDLGGEAMQDKDKQGLREFGKYKWIGRMERMAKYR